MKIIMNSLKIWDTKDEEKICAIDLDDTLACSIEYWIDFVNKKTSSSFKNLNDVKNNVPYNLYRNLKHDYRKSGVKLNIKQKDGASGFTHRLSRMGYKIIIITARPFEVHKELYKITNDWLNNNDIHYDGIIWGRNKLNSVMESIDNLAFVVEDHRYQANMLGKFGYKTYLLSNKYNSGEVNNNVIRVKRFDEIIKDIERRQNE